MISYAQQFEDVILWRALKDVRKGAYIDIGANDPLVDSVSMLFYSQGWRGLHVEPMPTYAQRLRDARPDEMVVEAAIGAEAETITLFLIDGTGLTTAIPEYATRHQEEGRTLRAAKVPCLPLSELFDQFNRRHVHWMKVDVEGMEHSVLASWGDHPTRPWVVVVESTVPNSPELCFEVWEDELLRRGYLFAYFDGLSRFYVHEDHKDLLGAFGVPPNVFDHATLSETSPFAGLIKAKLDAVQAQLEQGQQALSLSSSELEATREALHASQRALIETQASRSAIEGQIRDLTAALDASSVNAAALTESLETATRIAEAKSAESASLAAALDRERAERANLAQLLSEQASALETVCKLLELKEQALETEKVEAARQLVASRQLLEAERQAAQEAAALSEEAVREIASLREVASLREQLLARQSSEADALRRQNLALGNDLAARRAHVAALLASTSWKVTSPLRALSRLASVSRRGSKAATRPILEAGLGLVRANPWTKKPLLGAANLFPPVRRKIDHFVSVRSNPARGQLPAVPSFGISMQSGVECESIDAAGASGGALENAGDPVGVVPKLSTPERVALIQRRILDELKQTDGAARRV